MSAATTPRIRVLCICDEATASEDEDGVYSLEGVRYEVFAAAFPHRRSLSVYLLLSSAQVGVFLCIPAIINEAEDWVMVFRTIRAGFAEENEPVAIALPLGEIEFPEPGRYTFQVWFASLEGGPVLKGEQPFRVHQQVE